MTRIFGKRVGGEPENEAEHFELCSTCHQAYDKRDLAQMIYHHQDEHEPLAEGRDLQIEDVPVAEFLAGADKITG